MSIFKYFSDKIFLLPRRVEVIGDKMADWGMLVLDVLIPKVITANF